MTTDHNGVMNVNPSTVRDSSTRSAAAVAGSGQVRLTGLGLIQAVGADAASFLHGQLTQDVAGLGAADARLAAFCSAKGRMLASFVVWRPAADTVMLAVSADLLAPTLKRLSMFVLRAKCKLSDATADWALFASFGPQAEAALGTLAPSTAWSRNPVGGDTDPMAVIRLPSAAAEPFFLIAARQVDGVAQWPVSGSPLDGLVEQPVDAWQRRAILAGIPWITAATTEQFVPQMVNFELIGGVNFQKGCYPGQEVVARSHYRGTVKRRMQLFQTASTALPGQELFHSDDPGQPAGMVVNAAADPTSPEPASWLLAEVKLAALASGSLHLGAADGPLVVHASLPYALPEESLTGSTHDSSAESSPKLAQPMAETGAP